jgi:hypothetical protein
MYSILYSTNKNKIRVNLPYFRKLLDDPNVSRDKLIEQIVEMNLDILKNYKTMTFIINVDCLCLEDIKYLFFFKDLVNAVQERFKDNFDVIHITSSSKIFHALFDKIKVFLNPEIIKKFRIE